MTVASALSLIAIGDLTLCPEKRTLVGCRGEIVLSGFLFGLAERLFRRPGVIVSHSDLISMMYPDPDEEPDCAADVLRKRIMLLRSAVIVLGGDRVRIRNERKIGYVAEVRRGS